MVKGGVMAAMAQNKVAKCLAATSVEKGVKDVQEGKCKKTMLQNLDLD